MCANRKYINIFKAHVIKRWSRNCHFYNDQLESLSFCPASYLSSVLLSLWSPHAKKSQAHTYCPVFHFVNCLMTPVTQSQSDWTEELTWSTSRNWSLLGRLLSSTGMLLPQATTPSLKCRVQLHEIPWPFPDYLLMRGVCFPHTAQHPGERQPQSDLLYVLPLRALGKVTHLFEEVSAQACFGYKPYNNH